MDGKHSRGHIPRTQARGSDRFQSLTKPRGVWWAATVLWVPPEQWGGGGWHKASVSDCLPLAAPIGLSPLLILTLRGSEWGGGEGRAFGET